MPKTPLELFAYFWLPWVFVAAHGLPLVVVSGGYCLLQCPGFLLWWLLLLQSTGSRACGLSCSLACGIFLDQGLNPCPLLQQADSCPLHHQGTPCLFVFIHFS